MARNSTVSAVHDAPPITAILARFAATHPSRGWSDAVEHEAHRTLLNWLGCAVGAAEHEATRAALAACRVLEGAPQAAVLGRRERVDVASAALVNGIASHVFDFDDTHLKTIIHPAGPVAPALLALAELTGAGGRPFIDSLVLGIDVACRLGNMIYPEHYDRGWHITGSTGMLGAAAACARLLGLSVQQTQMALGIAASQPVGLREQFGSMTKSLHPGAAARAGLMAALMAREGYTASPRAIEAPRGFAQVVSTKCDWREVTDGLGERFEISFNTYKPYACGIVVHPAIEACARLREQGVAPDEVVSIELAVHPLVLELCGKREPADGLSAKFSVYHGAAAGLIFGRAGQAQFSDEVATRADVAALRRKVSATVDAAIAEDAVRLRAALAGGRVVELAIDHAVGSLERPLGDDALDAKVRDLVDPVLGPERARRLIGLARGTGAARDLHGLVAGATP